MTVDSLNDTLKDVLIEAGVIQRTNTNGPTPADAAIQHAVMDLLEREYEIDVMVKYGNDDAVQEKYGVSNSHVWGTGGREGWTRFRVERKGEVTAQEERIIDQVFLAIGAVKLGRASHGEDQTTVERHYLWPKDHPVTELMPNTHTSV